MNLERLKIIEECILAVCPYCGASAEFQMTTEHHCVAKPLWLLWDETLKGEPPKEDEACNSKSPSR